MLVLKVQRLNKELKEVTVGSIEYWKVVQTLRHCLSILVETFNFLNLYLIEFNFYS